MTTAFARARLAYRRLAQLHESATVVAWWRWLFGPVLSWLSPGRRRALLAAGALVVGLKRSIALVATIPWLGGPHGWLEGALLAVLLFALFAGVFAAARHFARLPVAVRRRPQVALHAVFWGAVVLFRVAAPAAGRGRFLFAAFIAALPVVLWRLGYLLLSGQRGRMHGTGLRDHVMYVFPLWGGSSTPIGKGLDYLARHEARTDDALARSQLAGAKLLLLSVLWSAVLVVMEGVVYGHPASPVTGLVGGGLGLVHLGRLLIQAPRAPVLTAWLTLYAELVRQTLRLAASGHRVVGLLRLAGFNVFRNTYKPLLSESVVEFWNRYYHYFKELLADFFFFPTFVRWFKGRPHLRMFAAVMMAACVGNVYYHVVLLGSDLIARELADFREFLTSRAFYCLLLALGIYVSMRREQVRRGEAVAAAPGPGRRILRILGVWTFFALISIWAAEGGATFADRTRFFLSLFGVH